MQLRAGEGVVKRGRNGEVGDEEEGREGKGMVEKGFTGGQ